MQKSFIILLLLLANTISGFSQSLEIVILEDRDLFSLIEKQCAMRDGVILSESCAAEPCLTEGGWIVSNGYFIDYLWKNVPEITQEMHNDIRRDVQSLLIQLLPDSKLSIRQSNGRSGFTYHIEYKNAEDVKECPFPFFEEIENESLLYSKRIIIYPSA